MSKGHRVLVFLLLVAVGGALFLYPPTKPATAGDVTAVLLASAFLLSFTALLAEPFFARPTDVVAAGVSILLLLLPTRALFLPWGAWYWIYIAYVSGAVFAAMAALLLLTDGEPADSPRNRASALLNVLAARGASGRVQYFLLFILSLLLFVSPATTPFIALSLYAGLIVVARPQTLAKVLHGAARPPDASVGSLLSVQGHNTFLVRLLPQARRETVSVGDLLEFRYQMDGEGVIRRAVAVEEFFLDQEHWVRAFCHPEIDRRAAALSPLSHHAPGAVYRRSRAPVADYLDDLVGVVHHGSEIASLRFQHVGRHRAQEGDLIQVPCENGSVLYQVVNARVHQDTLAERNQTDSVIGEAIQLGHWNVTRNAFERFGWVPDPRLPVTRAVPVDVPTPDSMEIELGKIPGTSFPVLLNRSEAVTHHTAVLGVTGSGKSVFCREMVRRLTEDANLRVIVIDFTREWRGKLSDLGAGDMIDADTSATLWKAIDAIEDEKAKFRSQQDKTLIHQKKQIIRDGFKGALDAFLKSDDKVRVFELPAVSQIEGVLEYTQWFFATLFDIARKEQCHGRQVCIVLEEAHTVIPEWNFIGISDKGAQALVNNISQIALQGRKYGIGFIVIAQRTATVSKTVLTQCNTIIAFQCFDGTSIDFLGHYLPRSVAEALPNLRFRRAVAFGKAIRGSVPLMFDVPDLQDVGTAS